MRPATIASRQLRRIKARSVRPATADPRSSGRKVAFACGGILGNGPVEWLEMALAMMPLSGSGCALFPARQQTMFARLSWIAAALFVAPALAQQPPAPAPSPCATEAHRQFDF